MLVDGEARELVVHFLGTAASPSMPVPFCACQECGIARAAGGRNLRRRSALLVDGVVLVDLGPDVVTASFDQRVSLQGVRWCLQTHAHSDHFDPEILASRDPDWRTDLAVHLSLVASRKTLEMVDVLFQQRCGAGSILDATVQDRLKLGVVEVTAYAARTTGDYQIVPFPANHGVQDALLYSIDDGRHAVFYGTDTATIPDAVWHDIRKRRLRYDLVVLDHTYGIGCRGSDHLCAGEVEELALTLRAGGILKEDGRILATHLSHEGIREHDRLKVYAAARGYGIAYDGLTVVL